MNTEKIEALEQLIRTVNKQYDVISDEIAVLQNQINQERLLALQESELLSTFDWEYRFKALGSPSFEIVCDEGYNTDLTKIFKHGYHDTVVLKSLTKEELALHLTAEQKEDLDWDTRNIREILWLEISDEQFLMSRLDLTL